MGKRGIDRDPDELYPELADLFKDGPLFTDTVMLFEGYGESDTIDSTTAQRFYSNPPRFHAFVFIGVARTLSLNGGLLFLVQDTEPDFPFKQVSLEMLRAMGVETLYCVNNRPTFWLPEDGNTLNFDHTLNSGNQQPQTEEEVLRLQVYRTRYFMKVDHN